MCFARLHPASTVTKSERKQCNTSRCYEHRRKATLWTIKVSEEEWTLPKGKENPEPHGNSLYHLWEKHAENLRGEMLLRVSYTAA